MKNIKFECSKVNGSLKFQLEGADPEIINSFFLLFSEHNQFYVIIKNAVKLAKDNIVSIDDIKRLKNVTLLVNIYSEAMELKMNGCIGDSEKLISFMLCKDQNALYIFTKAVELFDMFKDFKSTENEAIANNNRQEIEEVIRNFKNGK